MKRRQKKLLISITGMPGAGKGTLAAMLSKKYGVPHYSIGDIRRAAARRRQMTLAEYNKYGETHPATDREPDEWAARRAKCTGRGVFDGRMMFHFIPQSIKIFLDCDLVVGAHRIAGDPHEKRRYEADLSDERKAVVAQKRRIASDRRRYWRYYRINVFDKRHYDLIVDTTKKTPTQVLHQVCKFITKYEKTAKARPKV
jgi:predicted cytidylate kinase